MSGLEDRSDLDLMAHYDGELETETSSELSTAIADDAPSRAKLEALGQISELVRTTVETEVDQALAGADPFETMWAHIERQIKANGVSEAAAPAPSESAAPAAGLWGSIAAWFERYRSQVATGAVCAVAAAALVWVLRPPEKSVEYVEVGGGGGGGGAEVVPASLEGQPPEVESLEIYDGSGVVFTLEGDDGETAVIWLSSPEDTVEGPI